MPLKIKSFKVTDLHADPANVRKHSEQQIEKLMASAAAFGQQKPIVVDKNNVVRAGNCFFEVAKRLGWEKVDAIVTELDGPQAVAYAIADNRLAELSEWDNPALQATLAALEGEDFDLSTLGWTEAELAGLLPGESLDLDQADDDDEESGLIDNEERPKIESSHVRMVQLFLDTDTFPKFNKMVQKLSTEYGLTTVTDTVMECLSRAYNNH